MKKNENGRSMIEMLGVLAIIGVLSVGGIYGYTVAMRKYKANEIVQTASMLATIAQSANAGVGACVTLDESGLEVKPAGVTITGMTASKPSSGVSTVTIQITSANGNTTGTGDNKGDLCRAIEAIAPTADGDAATRAGYKISCSATTAAAICPTS